MTPPTDDTIAADGTQADLIGNRGEREVCSWDWQCSSDEGLICRPAFDGKPRCAKPGAVDDTCIEDDDCTKGLYCAGYREWTEGATSGSCGYSWGIINGQYSYGYLCTPGNSGTTYWSPGNCAQ